MTIKQYDKVRLKDGRTATIVDILEENTAYIADVDLPNSDWETVEIRHNDILTKVMNLKEYEGKRVKLLSTNGNLYEGIIGDYCYPEDDENNLEMIVLDAETKNGEHIDQAVGFYEKDIKSIEIRRGSTQI